MFDWQNYIQEISQPMCNVFAKIDRNLPFLVENGVNITSQIYRGNITNAMLEICKHLVC